MLRAITSFFMLPFLSRLLGLLILAAAFAQSVYDGARSIANNGVRVTTLNEILFALLPEKAAGLQAAVEGLAPWLWQAIVLPLTVAPAALVGLVVGTVLLWLGQPTREPIGFLTRP